jgi:carbon-monoxide dehydrogenase medium subunit
MLSSEFDFFAPETLSDALRLLGEGAEGTKLLAGGMSMLPAMNLGLLRPSAVVSLNHVHGLDDVEDTGEGLRLGALCRHERIEKDELVRTHVPFLAQAAAMIGDVQIRHRGTIGGSVAHADPAADYLPVLCALDAKVTLASAEAERTLGVREFLLDVMMTALEPDEAVVALEVPKVKAGARSAYVRLARVEGSFAIVNAAAIANGDELVVAIGGATPTPVVVEAPYEHVGEAAYDACEDAYGDLSGSPEYRREMARVLASRAGTQAQQGGAL